jgi:hypothetical protein
MVERIGSGEGRVPTFPATTPTGRGDRSAGGGGGGGGGVRGASETDDPSESDAPQKRQNCELGSEPPRHRPQMRSIASGAGAPSSMTRDGGMGAAEGGAGWGTGPPCMGGEPWKGEPPWNAAACVAAGLPCAAALAFGE